MKDIITNLSMTETKAEAVEKWREYVAAEKMYRKPEYTDMKKIYNQIKQGRKIIDILKVIQKGGVHDNFHPKLAIAKANVKTVWCEYYDTGTVYFINRTSTWAGNEKPSMNRTKEDIHLPKGLPTFDKNKVVPQNTWPSNRLTLRAPVPIIPANYMPTQLKDTHYILWEVDKWEMVPPTDPYLLERITKTLFVVLAAWDLTELEKSVMRGRMI